MKNVLLFLLLAFTITAGAKNVSISGRVVNGAGNAFKDATILLLNMPDSSILKIDVSDVNGSFSFEAEGEKKYLVKVIFAVGETTYSLPFFTRDTDTLLPDIIANLSTKSLKEVTIRSQKPLMEVHAGKMVLNVASSIISSGSTALEVLQRAPGVSVDQNDNISLKGKRGVNIMIDGKLLPVSGSDLADLLKNMPGTSIEKLEIISNPGAKYDAAGTAGIINIRTTRDKRMGANGSVNAGFSQGIYPKGNAGFNVNYRDGKFALYSNYNYSNRKDINNLGLLRRFYDKGTTTAVFDQTNDMTLHMQSHNVNLGCDYSLSSKTVLGTVLSAGSRGFDLTGNSRATVKDGLGTPQYFFNTIRNNSNNWESYSLNLNLRHQLDTNGSDINVDVDVAHYSNKSEQILNTIYLNTDGSQKQSDYRLYGDADGYTDIRSLKADYSKPFSKTLKLEAGIKSSLVKSDNNPAFFDQSSGGSEFDSGKSNHFIYNENINAGYINIASDFKKWSFQAGIRAEQTNANGHQLVNNDRFDRNYAQLFPSIAVTHHLNPKNDLGISFSRRIERPNYQQLNPFKRFLDVSSLNQGNPYLLPALTWSAELSHTWKGKFITQISWSKTTDVITQVIQPEAGQTTLVTEKNLATNTVYNFSGAYPLQFSKWWNSVNSINVWHTIYEGNLAGTALNDGASAFHISSQNTIILPNDWSAECSAWYQSAQLYGYMHVYAQYAVGFGFQKFLLDRKLSLKLSVTDIFLKQNPNGRSDFAEYHEDFTVLRDSRTANFSLTYRFGKRNIAPSRKRQRGAEDELRRAAGTGG